MGNINNCLINNVRFDEISSKLGKNDKKDNQFNKKNDFEIVNEENFSHGEKSPNDNISNKNLNNYNSNTSKAFPSNTVNFIENQNVTNFNNIKFNKGIVLDNNVLFNSTRKSNPMKKSFGKYQNNTFKDNKISFEKNNNFLRNNITQENVNISENNYGSNKVINTEEESDNLIVIDYNNPQNNLNNGNDINVNNINGYNNNDGYINNIPKINEINNHNLINNLDNTNKNIILDSNKTNKNSYFTFNERYNSNITNSGQNNKIDNNEQTQKSDKTVKNDFIETTNIFKKSIPYSKPKLNLYINNNMRESNKNVDDNNKNQNLINKLNDDKNKIPKDHDEYFASKQNKESADSQNINDNCDNEKNDEIISDNKIIENNDNYNYNFISNVRKVNVSLDENIPQDKQNNNLLKYQEEDNNEQINNNIYDNDNIPKDNNDNDFNQEIDNENNNEQILDKDGGILYQTATMNNAPEVAIQKNKNEYYNSNSLLNSNDLNEGINSPIIPDTNKYFPSNSNKNSFKINQIYINNNSEENKINNEEDIDELQQKLIYQSEPRDKDSEFDVTPKKSDNIKINMKNTREKENNKYQKKNWENMKKNIILEQNEQIINNGELISQTKNIQPENLFTPSKNNKTKIYKKKYITNTSQKTELKNTEPENSKKIEKMEENEIDDDFKDFDWNEWKRFYPEDDRFFKFPNEGIIHNQELNDSENDELYQGDLNKNGEKHGLGKYISKTLKRIGMWKRNKFTGWGKEIRQNGDIYEGKFINGELNGKGFYKNKIKNITYIGDFIDSKKHGKGELFTKDYHYKGDFMNNKFEGYGKIELYNEGEYEGTFKNGLFDGKGMLRWKDGSFYKGELSKGKQDGYGEETSKEGDVYKGYYSKGNKNGEGKLFTNDGNIYNCLFKDGKPIKNIDNN